LGDLEANVFDVKLEDFDSLYKTPCFGSIYIWNLFFFLHGFDRNKAIIY
jgi:hypothetical protein